MGSYCRHLYDEDTSGYVQIGELINKRLIPRNVTHAKLKNVVGEIKGFKDVFITSNTIYLPSRKVENIRQLRSLYIDLDIVNFGYFQTEAVYMVWDLVNTDTIPKPTMVVDSGRGIHLYWRIENAPKGAMYTWQELEDFLYYQLKHLGADRKATDAVRLLRLPETINSKNNSECKILIIDDDITYSMYDLRDKYLKHRFNNKVAKTGTSNKVITNKMFNSYSLHMARLEDIETLCKLREYNVKGNRNMILHCYAYWKGIYVRDLEQLSEDVNEFNNRFTIPLKQNEVTAIIKCVDKACEKFIAYEQGIRSGEIKRVTKGMKDKEGYWYKNETLIQELDITESEQKHMKTIIGTKEKYKRNNDKRTPKCATGLTKKQQELLEVRNKAIELRNTGLSYRKIAKELGKSLGTVQNILK